MEMDTTIAQIENLRNMSEEEVSFKCVINNNNNKPIYTEHEELTLNEQKPQNSRNVENSIRHEENKESQCEVNVPEHLQEATENSKDVPKQREEISKHLEKRSNHDNKILKQRKTQLKKFQEILKILEPKERNHLELFIEKYYNILTEKKTLETELSELKKNINEMAKEANQANKNHEKTVLTKNKLESLCRELQRMNKENTVKIHEEEEKRRKASVDFDNKIKEISSMVADNDEMNKKLREYNNDMTAKLEEILAKFEKKEELLEKLLKEREVEKMDYEGKIKECEEKFAMATKIWNEEREELRKCIALSEDTIKKLNGRINSLEDQLKEYVEKYDAFENTIKESNRVVTTCKKEMEAMCKNKVKMEKELLEWKKKWKDAATKAVDLGKWKKRGEEEIVGLKRKIEGLEKLCRRLHGERNDFLKQLDKNKNKPTTGSNLEIRRE